MPKNTSNTKQSERFIRKARELGCDEDPEAFARAVRKLAKAPPQAPRKRKREAMGEPSS